MEKVLIVDKKNNILASKEKTIAHKDKGILHRAFTIFLINDSGEILLQKRSLHKSLWPL